jgi:uncharacterized membrane protein YebE (DUF533 family)
MSLMGTLGKVAMGIIVAKGIGKIMGGNRGGSGGGLGGLLGSLTGGGASSSANQGGSQGGGLGDLLGGLAGKNGGGGLGGILDSLGGGSQSGSQNGSLGDIFNNALQGKDVAGTDEQEKQAKVLLRAMINAAKSDGKLDDNEKKKITEHLGDVSEDEARFVQQELAAPLDVNTFINDVPRGMEEQVYMMSLFAIDLDSKEEAQYLAQLAKGLSISHQLANQIHEKMGAPAIFA